MPSTTLPLDIQSQISTLVDFRTLSNLTHSWPGVFDQLARRKWDSINLALPPHYGERPIEVPFDERDEANHQAWSKAEADGVRERQDSAATEKLEKLFDKAGKADWEAVRRLRVCTTLGAQIQQWMAMKRVSANMTSLEIVGRPQYPSAATRLPISTTTLEYYLLSNPIVCPNLTTISITSQAIYNTEFCLILSTMAPNLLSLKASLVRYELQDPAALDNLLFPANSARTKLRKMELSWDEDGVKGEDAPLLVCRDLLGASPALQQLTIRAELGPEAVSHDHHLPGILVGLHHLSDFGWNMTGGEMLGLGWMTAFSGPRRVVLRLEDWVDTLPHMPNLERLYLDFHQSPSCTSLAGLGAMPQSGKPASMLPSFSLNLRANSKIRIIHTLYHDITLGDLGLFSHLDDIRES